MFNSHSSKQCPFINGTSKIAWECLGNESLSQMIEMNLYYLILLQEITLKNYEKYYFTTQRLSILLVIN